jgi:hypothetical protein
MSAKVQSGDCNRKGGGALRGPVRPKLYFPLKSEKMQMFTVSFTFRGTHALSLGAAGGPHARLTAATDELPVCFGL